MITLDQVLLLEKKVESAVAKIAQLNAENDALRSKCAELTNALEAKTEQFSAFQSDQGLIEEGILKALNRLSDVENTVIEMSESAEGDNTESVLNGQTSVSEENTSGFDSAAETAADSAETSVESENEFVEHFDPPVESVEENVQNEQVSSESYGEFTSSLEPEISENPSEENVPDGESSENTADSSAAKGLFDIF